VPASRVADNITVESLSEGVNDRGNSPADDRAEDLTIITEGDFFLGDARRPPLPTFRLTAAIKELRFSAQIVRFGGAASS
jgi:hypothetical protein